MAKKDEIGSYNIPTDRGISCCKVDSVISIDDRGQMILPKEIRDKGKIRAGDKLAVISWEKEEKICCICLIKTEDFTEMVKELLGTMMKDVTTK